MPRSAACLLLICLCAAGPSSAPASQPSPRKRVVTVPVDFALHKLPKSDATIQAPPKWREGTSRGNVLINLLAEDGSRANVNVVRVNRAGNDPAADGERMLKAIAAHVDNFERISVDVLDIGGTLIAQVVCEGDIGGKRLRWQQSLVPTPTHGYVITYAADVGSFAKHAAEVDQMLASFKTGE